MQREIRKKTLTYGLGALFLALLLTGLVYNYGTKINMQNPEIPTLDNSPPQATEPEESETPDTYETPETPEMPQISDNPQPFIPPEIPTTPEPTTPPQQLSNLKTFADQQDLEEFLKENIETARNLMVNPQYGILTGSQREFMAMEPQTSAPEATSDYSTTNIQVQGVDEADIIKSDGEYLYIVSGPNIYIIKAYPPNQAQIVSKIQLNETYTAQIYIKDNKLAIIGTQNIFYTYGMPEDLAVSESLAIWPYPYNENTFLKIYDISNKTEPILERTVNTNGTLSGSRMINDHLYLVVNQVIITQYNETDLKIELPIIKGNHTEEIQPDQIRYIDIPDISYRLTNIIAINIQNSTESPTYEPFLAGQATIMYVSQNNMYLVVPNTNIWLFRETQTNVRDQTLIYRIKLDQEKIMVMAEGSVPGNVLNQFSMDEHDNYFRVATTEWKPENSTNNLYILNMNMNIVGKIEDIAKGEQIYSARFVQDRGYLVTFRQIDPFYVIDLKEPNNPKILGYLKIPGFSGYLHPYDESHIIGIGKEENNLKLSLFNVTDVSNPTETAKFKINADYSDTRVLWDHKAFLFDKTKQLLALPVSINNYSTQVRPTYWQGAYVFSLSAETGFSLENTITHQSNSQYNYATEIVRIQYIEESLYTMSDNLLKMHDLDTHDFINQIELT